ncbi:type IV pilus modification protein PilV [Rhodoferax sp. TS-BS-61-7]|uniref:type IV pilus modification protein PilV n=1 Tax=Rhodoferax sp. TS-BS-61-7 TaxID=2094194 RepID=UPI000CF6D2A5|nr:type IV pilus modification protein PilV [Rhodoferax sp. TS-BS-61-7]PQA78636.1 type IV pilus modification protein PilV [Rhodoferax sp. TS-BS-61-7]
MSMSNQRGAGLIEALVAILVLSIGLLGMLGMQTAALKYEQSSWIRSALSSNIASLADRIRANSGSLATAYNYTRTYAEERAAIEASATYFDPAKDCDTTTCDAAELATYDLLVWRRDLDQQLPGATGFVVPTGTKGVDLRFLVTVAWYDKDNVDAGVLQSPAACTAATTGVAARNCCPAAVGATADLVGVRCANLEMVP